ncbi:diguanylate cyclase domain-containing protein [Vibrio cholerae]|uniref:diguanylate cyclase domain-containing protein n=1 Tax=Vibrio cholerae TaxID=666 RepID=UPI003D33588E
MFAWIFTLIKKAIDVLYFFNKCFLVFSILLVFILLLCVIFLCKKILSIKEISNIYEYEANHDFLTSLPNRNLAYKVLESRIRDAKKFECNFALVFIDLDGFKDINDKYGHEYGDNLLKCIGLKYLSIICGNEFVSRLGGDEFLFLSDLYKDQNYMNSLIKRIKGNGVKKFSINGKTISITESIGVSIYPFNGYSRDELLSSADIAMYKHKNATCIKI